MEEKSANRLTAAILENCRLENIESSKYQLIFVTAEEVFSRPFLSWLKKTALLIHSSALGMLFFSAEDGDSWF